MWWYEIPSRILEDDIDELINPFCAPVENISKEEGTAVEIEMEEVPPLKKGTWSCDYCEASFDTYQECFDHEAGSHISEKVSRARQQGGLLGRLLSTLQDKAATALMEEVEIRLRANADEYRNLPTSTLTAMATEASLSAEQIQIILESDDPHENLIAELTESERGATENKLAAIARDTVAVPDEASRNSTMRSPKSVPRVKSGREVKRLRPETVDDEWAYNEAESSAEPGE